MKDMADRGVLRFDGVAVHVVQKAAADRIACDHVSRQLRIGLVIKVQVYFLVWTGLVSG